MDTGGGKMKDLLVDALECLEEKDFKKFKSKLRDVTVPQGKNIPRGRLEKADQLDLVELLVEFYEQKAATLVITILEDMGFKKIASNLRKELKEQIQGYKKKYVKYVKEECKNVEERSSLCGESIPLNSCYAELLIIKKHQSQKQKEHELLATGRRHLEILSTNSNNHLSTDIEDLFEPDESGTIPKTVVLQGSAGIGKSMTVQKIMLDWADGQLYPDMFDYVFCIRCRELNFAKKASSLSELIIEQCQDRDAPVEEILAHPEKLLFIVDGFDELPHLLEFEANLCEKPSLKVPLENVLNSLLRKILLPESFLLITTRPGALERLQQCLKHPKFTEIVGFSEKGRREFFSMFFEEEEKANIALRFIENTVAVSTICFIPMVCWIICSVIKIELETEDEIAGTLDTTTRVFLQFSHILLKHDNPRWKTSPQNEFRKLCSLARAGIMQQKILFEEQDLKEHGLDVSALKDLFLEKRAFRTGLARRSIYSFFHLCFQEFFAAMWYMLPAESTEEMDHIMADLQRVLVEWEMQNNQHFALSVCFIFGLTNEKTHVFFEQTLQCKTSDLVKRLLLQKLEDVAVKCVQKCYLLLNFFHCLFESQEPAFAKRVTHHFQIIDLSYNTLSVLDCKVLAFCLQHSTIEEHSLILNFCRLKCHHIKALAPGIKNCTTLEFGENKFGNSGVNVLCIILKQLGCNLANLKLDRNYLTDACVQELCTVLSAGHRLYSLDLRNNSFTKNSVPFIQDLMKNCTTLTIVNLFSNSFNERGRRCLDLQAKKINESGRDFLLWM